MSSPPLPIHTAAQIRALDRRAAEALGIASYILMTRAGAAACALLRSAWPHARRIAVVCGPGANGGDGFVLARCARQAGLMVDVACTVDPAQLEGDARRAFDDFLAAGGEAPSWSEARLREADVVVDAIFGTGLSRPIEGVAAERIRAINACGAPVLALDIPSGLHADTGRILGTAVIAERTLTFIGLKLGFYLDEGPNHTGCISFDALGAPPDILASAPPIAMRLGEDVASAALPRRRRTAHKGAHGRVLVIGGGRGMPGAARLAAEAALRVGAGLVSVATRPEHVAAIVAGRPELICFGVERAEELPRLIERADVLALGPGLGQDEWSQRVFDVAIASDKPAVIDADGLNLLAQHPRTGGRWVLTPHPGEAGRLLGAATETIQDDRLAAARSLAARYQAIVVLKGAGAVIVSGDSPPAICDRGNPGMASAGTGDVLTGVIAGLAAQALSLEAAARVGVFVHATAGDLAAARGERGLLASDLFEHLRSCVNRA